MQVQVQERLDQDGLERLVDDRLVNLMIPKRPHNLLHDVSDCGDGTTDTVSE